MKNFVLAAAVAAVVSFAQGVTVSSVADLRAALADETVTEITIAPGTYELDGQLEVTSAVTVTGNVDKPETVVLKNTADGARVLKIDNASAIVQGVTLTGGQSKARGDNGAGAWIASGTLANSRIVGNKMESMSFGSGVYLANNSNAILRDSFVAENLLVGSFSVGVVYCASKKNTAKVIRCEIAHNTASGNAVGTPVVGTTISDSFIHHNMANAVQDLYGGLWGYGAGGAAHADVRRCRIYENTADIPNGGLAASALRDCTVYDSLVVSNGGVADKAAIIDCTLYGCTVAGNRCNTADGYLVSGGCKFYNCIVWDNLGGVDGTEERVVAEDGNVAFNTCCVGVDPLFNTSLPFPQNWTFPVESPCYNAGDNALIPSASDGDLFGNDRIFARKVDLGCIEVVPETAVGELALARATFYGADLDITVDCFGTDAESVDVVIEYSSAEDFSDVATVAVGTVSGALPQTVQASLSGLDHGATYFVRARFTNAEGRVLRSHPLCIETLSQPFAYNPVLQFSETDGVLTVAAEIVELYGNVSLSAVLRVDGGAAVPMILSGDGKTFALTDAALAKTGFYEVEISATLGSYSSTSYARWSDTRYLAADGDDANQGFSAAAPLATVAAVKASLAGDTKRVLIDAGDYMFDEEWIVTAPLLIAAYPGVAREEVVLKGRGESGGYRLFTLNNKDAELRGVTVADGCASDGIRDGGGINLQEGTVNGCVVRDCRAPNVWAHAGGIYAANTTSCIITNTLFSGNSGFGVGALYQGVAYDCQFVGNREAGNGGNAWSHSGGADGSVLWRCRFEDNTSKPGVVSCVRNVTAYDCLFVGGGSANTAAEGTFYNCTFTGNVTSKGALKGTGYNCVSWGNTGANYADGANLYFCCTTPAQENWATAQAGEPGYGCTDGDPKLTADGRLGKGSVAINVGCNDYVTSLVDLTGIIDRIIGRTVDMGCYESPKITPLVLIVR